MQVSARLIVNRAAFKTDPRGRRAGRALPRAERRARPPDAAPQDQRSRFRGQVRRAWSTTGARAIPTSRATSPTSSTACATRGDEAVIEYTMRFDNYALARTTTGGSAAEACERGVRGARRRAARRARARRRRASAPITSAPAAAGPRLHRRGRRAAGRALARGRCRRALRPGGRAAYPSSLLMNAIPAKVAGVERLVDGHARRPTARSTRWSSPPRISSGSTRSGGSAARRRSPRSPTAPSGSSRST